MMKKIITLAMLVSLSLLMCACSKADVETSGNATTTADQFINPGDYLGGGQQSQGNATKEVITTTEINSLISGLTIDETTTYSSCTTLTAKTTITAPGNYLINSAISGSIEVGCEDVHLFLNNAEITNGKKVIASDYDLIITVLGENTLTNTNAEDTKNVISCDGNLTINGNGILNITSVKSGIKADGTLSILDVELDIDAQSHGISAESIFLDGVTASLTSVKDGIHAEIDYDSVTEAPTYTNQKGYVYLHNSNITINSVEDGIQSDSFILIDGGTINITANNGVPTTITEQSSDNASGKGIKAGEIDYIIGEDEYELASDNYGIIIKSGTININANDDAIHSNGYLLIENGNITIKSGDDGIHAETVVDISNGTINVEKSYEALEGAKVQINGGTINLNATDDGINAADGTTAVPGLVNSNCHIIITGGTIYVNAGGDGVDSNGVILMTGGSLMIDGPTNSGNGSLDSEGGFVVNGGTIFACGSLGMVEVPTTDSTQYVVSFASKSSISANTILTVTDSNQNTICTFTPSKSCQSVIISSSSFALNQTYSIYGGDTLLGSFTIKGIITSVGTSSTSINPGGRPFK